MGMVRNLIMVRVIGLGLIPRAKHLRVICRNLFVMSVAL